jgi:hypothetical protein
MEAGLVNSTEAPRVAIYILPCKVSKIPALGNLLRHELDDLQGMEQLGTSRGAYVGT